MISAQGEGGWFVTTGVPPDVETVLTIQRLIVPGRWGRVPGEPPVHFQPSTLRVHKGQLLISNAQAGDVRAVSQCSGILFDWQLSSSRAEESPCTTMVRIRLRRCRGEEQHYYISYCLLRKSILHFLGHQSGLWPNQNTLNMPYYMSCNGNITCFNMGSEQNNTGIIVIW